MKITIDELAAQAMTLPSESRTQLIEKLIESLEQEAIERLWISDAKRRRDEVRNGKVKPIPGEEALEYVRKLVTK
jgi:hypothetical protein